MVFLLCKDLMTYVTTSNDKWAGTGGKRGCTKTLLTPSPQLGARIVLVLFEFGVSVLYQRRHYSCG